MRNIKLKIQYDGTDYHGWQIQKNDITVQETVKKAVQKIVNEDVHLTGADEQIQVFTPKTMYATFSQIQEYRLKNCRMR